MFLFETHAQNEVGRLVSDLFFFFKKVLYEVKASGLKLSDNIFLWPSNCKYQEQTVYFRLFIQRYA